MMRTDMAEMTATSIPDWTINSEIYGMKLCRLPGLEKVQDISPVILNVISCHVVHHFNTSGVIDYVLQKYKIMY